MAEELGADAKITQEILAKLVRSGVRAPCRVVVNTSGGDVTLSGTVQQDQQKSAAMRAAASISGVRRVIDHMTVKPSASHW